MKVTVEKQEGNKIHLQIEVDGGGIAQDYRAALSQYGRELKIKGFRKGKIPIHLVEQYVDTDRLKQDVFQHAVGQSYQQALSEQQIEAIAEPQIEPLQTEIGKDFVYRAVVEVRPEVSLGQYKGLSIHVEPQGGVGEEELETQLKHLQREHAVLIPVDDRPAQLGDLATMRIEGSIEGESIDLGESKDMTLELREDSFVRGFSDHIVGMQLDETKEFELTFPDDYYVEDLRNKPIQFHVHLQELKEVELAELDDDLASTVDNTLETLEQLKERLQTELEENAEEQFEIQKQQRVLDRVVAGSQVEVPESMMQREMFAMWQMGEGAQLSNAKVNENTLRASWIHWMQREDMQETARQRIKTTLVLGAIAREENLQLSDEEVEAEIQDLSETHGVPVEQVRAQLQQENRMVALMDELLSYKIIDWVMDNNEIIIDENAEAHEEAAVAELEQQHAPEESPSETSQEAVSEVGEQESVEQPA